MCVIVTDDTAGCPIAVGGSVMRYRADIDGLRALAIIPVLFYHVGVPGFAGGFVGVDVFFVISGYLICGLIDADIKSGSFSLGNFYKRRILRILPALFVMFLVTSVLAYAYCLPVELQEYSKSLASAVGSVSNIYFAGTAGYFDAPAATKPLLHTWSLGVEEQFYLIAPLLMLLAYRFLPKRAKLLFAILAVLSFAAAFAGELSEHRLHILSHAVSCLGAGARRAACRSDSFRFRKPNSGRNICGATGMLLVLGAIVFGILVGSASGRDLRLPASGPLLLIASSERGLSMAGRLLSLRPVVFIGLISYSLYLWHWPLIVFQRTDGLLVADASNAMTELMLIVASIGVAWPVMEIRRVAVPVESQGQLPRAVGVRYRVDRDDLGRCALRPGADRKRGAVPLSRARGRDRLLSRL